MRRPVCGVARSAPADSACLSSGSTNNTEERVVMPAPGASLKGVQAYLSRWGLAQPRPRTLHSQAAEQPRTNRKEADL